MRSNIRGAALIDVVCSTTLCIVMAAMAVPVIGGTLERERTMAGAHHLAGLVQRARMEALRRAAFVALRIEVVGRRASLRMYVDGNGNGVLQRDIDRELDPSVTGVDWLDQHARDVSLRINQQVPDIGGIGSLAPGDDPIRIGRTALLAFSPLGSSTSGTLYLAAPAGPQMAVRIFGATGRVRVLMFDRQIGQWRP